MNLPAGPIFKQDLFLFALIEALIIYAILSIANILIFTLLKISVIAAHLTELFSALIVIGAGYYHAIAYLNEYVPLSSYTLRLEYLALITLLLVLVSLGGSLFQYGMLALPAYVLIAAGLMVMIPFLFSPRDVGTQL